MSSSWNHRIWIASNHGGDPAVMNAVAAITVGYDARGGWLGSGDPPNHFLIHDFHSNDDGSVYAAAIMNALQVISLFESMTLDGNPFSSGTHPPPPPPPPPSPGARTVTTDKATYTIGDTLHFTGTGFTPNGNVSKCMTTTPPAGVCAGAVTADAQGNVSGDFGIGTNIPAGTQNFWLHDQTANIDAHAPQITIQAQGPPTGPRYSCVSGSCVVDPNGPYVSLSACQAACSSPPPPTGCGPTQIAVFGQCVDQAVLILGVGGAIALAGGAIYLMTRRRRNRKKTKNNV